MTLHSLQGQRIAFAGVRAVGRRGLEVLLFMLAGLGLFASEWGVPQGGEFWKQTVESTPPKLLSEPAPFSGETPPPDFSNMVDRLRHAFGPANDDGVRSLTAAAFAARVQSDGIEFLPATARDETPFRARTRGVYVGGESLLAGQPPAGDWVVTGNTAQRLLQPGLGLVEHVEARAQGVEVTWVLGRPPDANGDLTIDWEFTGRSLPAGQGTGWRLAGNSPRANVLVSEAIAVDSAGRRLRLEARATGHGLVILVPETFLHAAVYPVAIDPLISAEFDLDSPVTTAAPSAQFSPAAASDGTDYLVIWHDNRNGAGLDLYAARVTGGGVVLDPSGFAISTALNDQWQAAVAYNGTNYLVAWQDARNGGQDIYAARVTPSGQVLETNGLPVATIANDQRVPAVASLNGDFLVTWQDGRNGAANQDIYAARITGGGTLVETNGFVVSNAANSQSAPANAVVGTNYVVVWHDFRSGVSLDVYAARVTPGGTLLDANAFVVSAAANDQWNIAIASAGATGLITWQDGRNGTDDDLYGARVNESGGVLDAAGLAISQQAHQQRLPAVGGLGENFFVTWQDSRLGAGFDLYGTTVNSANGTIGSVAGTLIAQAANDQRLPTVVRSGDELLVVWEDIRNGIHTDIMGCRIDLAGTPLNNEPLLVSTVANAQEAPAIASNGSIHLAVWRDFRNDPLGDVYGARIGADGALLDPAGIAISTAANYQLAPQVAASGDDFLVVWQDFRNGVHDDVVGARVTAAGSVLDPQGLLVSTALGAQRVPSVASNASGYLVVWQDRRSGSGDDVYASRVTPEGDVLDANGLVICNALGDQQAPAVAGLGDSFFVAWEDFRDGVQKRIQGTRVNAEGQVAGANGFALSSVAGEQLAPRVAASTNQFLTVWQGRPDAGAFNIFGTRVSADGVVVETNSIVINASAGDQTRPQVAGRHGNFTVVWEDQRVAGRTNLFTTRLTASGTVLEPAGELTAPDTGRHRLPAIASAGENNLLIYQTRDAGNVARVRGVLQYPAAQPTIGLSPGSATFVAGGGPVRVDAEAILVDGGAASFEGGTLTVNITANATTNDRLGIQHQGVGPGEIGVNGNAVSYGGTLVGFFTGGTSGTSPLLVILSADANAEAVEALARHVTFNDTASPPFTQPRTVRFTLSLPAGVGSPSSRNVEVITADSIPVIVTQPVGQTAITGSNIVLAVVASGSQPISYQWRLNGQDIAGATNSTYTIASLDTATAGAYTAMVSNAYDAILSEAAAVTVFDLAMYAGLTIAGPAGANYRIEYRPAVSDEANWMTLTNVTLGAGPLLFFDSGSGKLNQRFYRAIRTD
ncbi:MAG TPA: immunoglobulin domain-containing protein [Verrucomicrobiae bacterium]|nr:immunoglobulin domain-containing protein [Verrucomicrobiae bacterium]